MSENDKSEIKDVKAERRLNMSGAIGISERACESGAWREPL